MYSTAWRAAKVAGKTKEEQPAADQVAREKQLGEDYVVPRLVMPGLLQDCGSLDVHQTESSSASEDP